MAKKPAEHELEGIDLSALSSSLLSGATAPQNKSATYGNITQNEKGYYDIPLNIIEEDPNQPRNEDEFNLEALEELAGSIKSTGLQTPITVRKHPDNPDKYMIHTGARRFRAFIMLNRKTIPAVIDDKATMAGQMVENIHREPLKPKAVIRYIEICQAKGMKLNEIAEGIGVVPSFISMHKKIKDSDIPEIKRAFEEERFTSMPAAYEMIALAKKHEKAVREFIAADEGEITRGMVKKLKERLERQTLDDERQPVSGETANADGVVGTEAGAGEGGVIADSNQEEEPPPAIGDIEEGTAGQEDQVAIKPSPSTTKPAKVHIFAEYKDEVVIILAKEPSGKTKAVIKTQGGEETEVPIKSLTLLRIAAEQPKASV
jgi:ParB family chromosome partitioning protein